MKTKPQPVSRTRRPLISSEERTALKTAICECTRDIVCAAYGDRLHSLLLTGSLARSEATFLFEHDHWHLLGDADFFLVFKEHVSFPHASALEAITLEIENRLLHCGIAAHFGLSSISPQYLRSLQPRIASYELRILGQVVWGDPQILSLIPAFGPEAISREDAWRMLCNRVIEFLEHVPELCSQSMSMSSSLHYATVKLILDSATSYLVFLGQYAPTFRARAEQLRALSKQRGCDVPTPFPLETFSDQVWRCTQWKLSGGAADCDLRPVLWEEAVRYAQLLLRWEMLQLTSAPSAPDDKSLWAHWMRRQTVPHKVRGWLSVLRRRKGYRNWPNWGRWTRLSLRSTPRYLLYQVAMEILVRLPLLTGERGGPPDLDADWAVFQALLPEPVPIQSTGAGWRQLAAAVVWNYKEFLVDTQA